MGVKFRITESDGVASSLSDEELMSRYQRGDEAAFDEIYTRYGKKIYGFLMRRLRQPDDCSDLFQETFLRLHKSRSLYRPDRPFKAWVYTIANNLVRDRLRSKTRLENSSVGEDKEHSLEIPDGLDHLVSFKEIFGRLTEDQREAIVLSRFQGLRYEEIAEVMGRSIAAVNQLIQRAMSHLMHR